MKQSQKTLLIWVLILLAFVALWQYADPGASRTEQAAFSDFMSLVRAKPEERHVEKVDIKDREYSFTVVDPSTKKKEVYKTVGPVGDAITKLAPSRAHPAHNDVATLKPSPTYAILNPFTCPLCSSTVSRSASP